jgi:hypothetical protein
MAKKTGYTPNKRRSRELLNVMDSALYGGAEAVLMAIDSEFASRNEGFIDGEYATGYAANSNEVTAPFTKRGLRRIRVQNTANREGRPYPVFWEVGWFDENGTFHHAPLYEPALMRAMPFVLPSAARQVMRGRTDPGTSTTRGSVELRIP